MLYSWLGGAGLTLAEGRGGGLMVLFPDGVLDDPACLKECFHPGCHVVDVPSFSVVIPNVLFKEVDQNGDSLGADLSWFEAGGNH